MQMCIYQGNVRFKVNKDISIIEGKIALRPGCRLEKSSSVPSSASASWQNNLSKWISLFILQVLAE